MFFQVREVLKTFPGLRVPDLGSETRRIVVELPTDNEHFDVDRLRQHPLIKQEGVLKRPGISGTVCPDECDGRITLASYYPEDLLRVIKETSRAKLPIPA